MQTVRKMFMKRNTQKELEKNMSKKGSMKQYPQYAYTEDICESSWELVTCSFQHLNPRCLGERKEGSEITFYSCQVIHCTWPSV